MAGLEGAKNKKYCNRSDWLQKENTCNGPPYYLYRWGEDLCVNMLVIRVIVSSRSVCVILRCRNSAPSCTRWKFSDVAKLPISIDAPRLSLFQKLFMVSHYYDRIHGHSSSKWILTTNLETLIWIDFGDLFFSITLSRRRVWNYFGWNGS